MPLPQTSEQMHKLVMLVDDDPVNLMVGKKVLAPHYQVLTSPGAESMFALLPRHKPDLILLDVSMPEISGFEAIQKLKADADWYTIPVIFLTGRSDQESEVQGLELGAIDYITKPFSPPLLLKRVELHLSLVDYQHHLERMVAEKTEDLLLLQYSTLDILAELADERDTVTGAHHERTYRCLAVFLEALRNDAVQKQHLQDYNIELVLRGSKLHDIGKIAVSDHILKKPARLEPEEFQEIQKHVEYGVKFITKLEQNSRDALFLTYAKTLAAYHHEKWNGSGYPYGLAGEAIPFLGRAMAIVDVYEALTAPRPYKEAFDHDTAMRIILENRGSHFDPALVEIFLKCADKLRAIPPVYSHAPIAT
ncbi:MAG: response regulator [Zoogloeaceae bacterium]|nr:response regulator [Zoogloeaceae bacterium]